MVLKNRFYSCGVMAVAAAGVAMRAAVSPWKIYHPDSGLYLQLARRIVEGSLYIPLGGERGFYQPLFPAASALMGLFTNNLEIAGCLVSVIASGATIVIAGAIGREVYSDRAGLLAALIAAFHPGMVHFGGLALTESLYTALFSGAALVGIKALGGNYKRHWFGSGALLGLAYLTRVAGLFELPVLMFWAWFSNRGKRGAWKMPLLAVAGCVIFAAPYIGYLRHSLGKWYITGQQGLAYYVVMAPDGRADFDGILTPDGGRFAARAKAERLSGTKVIFSRLDYLAKRSTTNFKAFYTRDLPRVFQPFFMMLIALGIVEAAAGRKKPEKRLDAGVATYLFSWWLTTVALQMALLTNYRYYIPFVPIMAPMGAIGVEFAAACFSGKKRSGAALKIITALLIATFVATTRFGPDPDAEWVGIQRRAANWIKQNHAEKVVVLTREPYVAFFAGGDQVRIPREPLPVVLKYAARYDVNYMVIDSLLVFNFHPQMAPLLNPENALAGWRMVHAEREGQRTIYVYKKTRTPVGNGQN